MVKAGGKSLRPSAKRKKNSRRASRRNSGHRFLWPIVAVLAIGLGLVVLKVESDRRSQANAGNMFVNSAVVNKLPTCDGSDFFASPVIPIQNSVRIVSIGAVDPAGGYNFPADHLMIQVKQQTDQAPTPTVVTAVLSPGDMHYIGASQNFYYKNGHITRSDWAVVYTSCRQFVASNAHIANLSGGLQAAVTESKKWCDPVEQSAGNQSSKRCTYHFDYPAKSGEIIGQTGGEVNGPAGVDWSATDYRTPSLKFINQSMGMDGSVADIYHAVCATDYYTSGPVNDFIQSQLPDRPAPRCGSVMQDLPSTAQGDWRLSTTSAKHQQWTEQMSIIHDKDDPSIGVISVGGHVVAADSGFNFYPTQGGLINREPSQVRQDGHVYCYQGDAPNIYNDSWLGSKVLVQLVGSKKMNVEAQGGSCTGNDSFTKPITYIR